MKRYVSLFKLFCLPILVTDVAIQFCYIFDTKIKP